MQKIFLLLFVSISALAQQDSVKYKYWLTFTDKNNSNFSISNPEDFLSARAISRRQKQEISIKIQDLPINSWYLDSIRDLGFDVLNRSKWFNGVVLETNDSSLVNQIDFPFIESIFIISPFHSQVYSN